MREGAFRHKAKLLSEAFAELAKGKACNDDAVDHLLLAVKVDLGNVENESMDVSGVTTADDMTMLFLFDSAVSLTLAFMQNLRGDQLQVMGSLGDLQGNATRAAQYIKNDLIKP